MLKTFDKLIESFIQDKVGITEDFTTTELAQHLKENLLLLLDTKKLKAAGIGHQKETNHDKLIRSDQIYWLDRIHHDVYEDAFLDLIDAFVSYLNKTCFAGITSYEFHYSLYEEGAFYLKHLDQFQSNNSRKYSMIMYLNTGWRVNDGGELCIHHQSDQLQLISPDNRKMVFFKSNELVHEVLVTHQRRMSITGWLKAD